MESNKLNKSESKYYNTACLMDEALILLLEKKEYSFITIKEICEKTGKEFVVKYAWAEEYVSPVFGKNTDEWCEEFGVEKCGSIKEVCEKADYIVVLAPSNPEKHLAYVKEVFKYKKNTYVDKTFAPDYATAKEMFDIANQYGTKFFSTSALRYASELDDLMDSQTVFVLGDGGNMEEYIVHEIEMTVKILDKKALAVRVEKHGNQYVIGIKFEDGKYATLVFATFSPYIVSADNKEGKPVSVNIESSFFTKLTEDMLRFFETGETSFDVNQTLEIMKIRDAIINGKEKLGEWVEL